MLSPVKVCNQEKEEGIRENDQMPKALSKEIQSSKVIIMTGQISLENAYNKELVGGEKRSFGLKPQGKVCSSNSQT